MPCFDATTSASTHGHTSTGDQVAQHLARLEESIDYAAGLLPAEGPIGAFVFLNPLHAFEHLPFTEAVPLASRMFGCEPFLAEDQYRKELDLGRILISDLRAELEEEMGGRSWELVGGLVSRLDLRLSMLRCPTTAASAAELNWYLEESDALRRFQPDVTVWSRDRISADARRWVIRDLINAGPVYGNMELPATDPRRNHVLWPLLSVLRPLLHGDDRSVSDQRVDAVWEETTLRVLWTVCRHGVDRMAHRTDEPKPFPGRHRTLLLAATGVDSDELVNDVLMPFCAAYADQGLATWPLPDRNDGFFKSFCRLSSISGGAPVPWRRKIYAEAARLLAGNVSPLESIHESLEILGVPEAEWEEFLPTTVLALRGWSSMLRQLEVRGDRVAISAPRGTFVEFLAVRLLLDRLAIARTARDDLGYRGELRDLRAELLARTKTATGPSQEERTFAIFRLALMLGWCPSYLHGMSAEDWTGLLAEIDSFAEADRRRVYHLAYERRYRTRALDAIAAFASRPSEQRATPRFQAAFCIDAREESFRRHLEEVAPNCETFGAAGFFGVPMYYRGAADAHSAALCPIVVRPQHWVGEEVIYPLAEMHRQRQITRRVLGHGAHQLHLGTRGLALGAVLSAGAGVLATFPLITRIMFPRLSSWLMKTARSFVEMPALTRLVLERTESTPGSEHGHVGFAVEEMTNIGEHMLRDIGLTTGFARLVMLFGHGSHSLNNPHKAAYDCGACSGSAGGPNARALAAMLNDPRVREALVARGLAIPVDTIFVGGLHNTATEAITYYDLDLLPKSHLSEFESARDALDRACEWNAHERCRRFESAPLNASPAQARRHAADRTEDLAQTRPEFGNAANAICVVGRRRRTRGLFLDRRSFMHSYDPTQDDAEGTVLGRILSAVVPVCQGINLQYFFSAVDRIGWGCGTKLPHNVTSLLGVMDGARSDLRQGLPWQGVEIHEPLRLLFVIETTPDVILKIMERNREVGRILSNGWAQMAVLDPQSGEIKVYQNGEFHLHYPERSSLPVVRTSQEWYTGRRGHLDFAAIESIGGTDSPAA